jgi:hypothetical protein
MEQYLGNEKAVSVQLFCQEKGSQTHSIFPVWLTGMADKSGNRG